MRMTFAEPVPQADHRALPGQASASIRIATAACSRSSTTRTPARRACIGCRLCEYVCPPAVIKVEMLKSEKRNYAKTFTLELYACEFCELCVQVCPTDAIVMMKSFDLATTDRREMLLDKDRLHAIGLQHQPSWATGNLLRDMQATAEDCARAHEAPRRHGRPTAERPRSRAERRRP